MRIKKSPMSAPLKWTLHANPLVSIQAMQSVLLLMCPKTGSKGTGFLLKSGCVVTTAHVVEQSRPGDIWGLDVRGRRITFSRVIADAGVDLALLRPSEPTFGDFELAAVGKLELGLPLWAWGFPFGYVGPTPLVSVGHVAGYSAKRVRRRLVPQVVINGAFNVGNSGGPLCVVGGTQVVGVVASKHVPPSPFIDSALKALAQHQVGPQLLAIQSRGGSKTLGQSELVAQVLERYRDFFQVMIGEAVPASEVLRFLTAHARQILPTRPRPRHRLSSRVRAWSG
jgi:S1-C subfamily serine protease